MKLEKGFTLAEVLITLAIIGVVAALTIPAVVKNYQKQQMEVKLNKVYTTLNMAINRAIADYGDPLTWDWNEHYDSGITNIQWAQKYMYPYLKGKKVAQRRLISAKTLDNTEQSTWSGDYYLQDGTSLVFRGGGSEWSEDPWVWITIDLNGDKKPNIFGRDIFNLFFYAKKRFHSAIWVSLHLDFATAMKSGGRSSVINTCRTNSIATYCVDLIMLNGWHVPEDYPWQ